MHTFARAMCAVLGALFCLSWSTGWCGEAYSPRGIFQHGFGDDCLSCAVELRISAAEPGFDAGEAVSVFGAAPLEGGSAVVRVPTRVAGVAGLLGKDPDAIPLLMLHLPGQPAAKGGVTLRYRDTAETLLLTSPFLFSHDPARSATIRLAVRQAPATASIADALAQAGTFSALDTEALGALIVQAHEQIGALLEGASRPSLPTVERAVDKAVAGVYPLWLETLAVTPSVAGNGEWTMTVDNSGTSHLDRIVAVQSVAPAERDAVWPDPWLPDPAKLAEDSVATEGGTIYRTFVPAEGLARQLYPVRRLISEVTDAGDVGDRFALSFVQRDVAQVRAFSGAIGTTDAEAALLLSNPGWMSLHDEARVLNVASLGVELIQGASGILTRGRADPCVVQGLRSAMAQTLTEFSTVENRTDAARFFVRFTREGLGAVAECGLSDSNLTRSMFLLMALHVPVAGQAVAIYQALDSVRGFAPFVERLYGLFGPSAAIETALVFVVPPVRITQGTALAFQHDYQAGADRRVTRASFSFDMPEAGASQTIDLRCDTPQTCSDVIGRLPGTTNTAGYTHAAAIDIDTPHTLAVFDEACAWLVPSGTPRAYWLQRGIRVCWPVIDASVLTCSGPSHAYVRMSVLPYLQEPDVRVTLQEGYVTDVIGEVQYLSALQQFQYTWPAAGIDEDRRPYELCDTGEEVTDWDLAILGAPAGGVGDLRFRATLWELSGVPGDLCRDRLDVLGTVDLSCTLPDYQQVFDRLPPPPYSQITIMRLP